MTGTSSSPHRLWSWAPLAVAAVAWGVRTGLLWGKGGAWGYGVDYDEGVYFTAASLIWKGVLPYRDFVFVHPPGILAWLLVPAGLGHFAVGPFAAFALARHLATFVGAASVYLAYRLGERRGGPVAGLAAGLALALYPETVQVDRGVFLEPVLNLACLAMISAVDLAEARPATRDRWLLMAGLCAGAAVAVKLWAGIWVLAALVLVWKLGQVRAVLRFLLPAGLVALALVVPALVLAPHAFFEQVVTFHTLRPPDGLAPRGERLAQLFALRHAGSDALALLGLGLVLLGPRRDARHAVVALAFAGTLAAFLANPSYWEQYNAHLAPSSAVLAGVGADWLFGLVAGRGARWQLAAALGLLALSLPSIVGSKRTFGRTQSAIALGRQLQGLGAERRICAFEPAWLLAADRLPHRAGTAGHLVDTYALGLLEAGRSGKTFASATAAFEDEASQPSYRAALGSCDVAVMGWRGRFQLAAPLEEQITLHWQRVDPTPPDAPDVFARP